MGKWLYRPGMTSRISTAPPAGVPAQAGAIAHHDRHVDLAVPLPRERGVNGGSTLRDHLGLDQPAASPEAA